MKKFFEEYGFIILASIVVILLIIMVGPIGSLIQSNISHVVESFSNKVYERLVDGDSLQPKTVIVIDNKEYIIIQHEGATKYMVLAQKQGNLPYDSKANNNYQNSTIDNWLNSENGFYGKLSPSIKDAIVPQKISQSVNWNKTDNQNNNQKVSNPSCGNGTCWCVLVNGELVNALNATKYFPQKGRHGAFYNFVEYKSLKSKSFERKIFYLH